jgi:hypothetical protein
MLRSNAVGSNVLRAASREARRRDRDGVLDLFTKVARNLPVDVSTVSSFLTMTCKRQACRKSTLTFVLRMPCGSGL